MNMLVDQLNLFIALDADFGSTFYIAESRQKYGSSMRFRLQVEY